MRFIYEYRTSDNAPHTGEVVARNREDAFQKLREQGIRPGRVTEAPGFFNKLFGKGKRWIAIGVLGLGCLVLAMALSSSIRDAAPRPVASPRHQIYGDPVIMEPFERGDFSAVFADEGDRYLARYAQPGRLMGPKGVRPPENPPDFSSFVPVLPDDSREVRELKEIVNGMHEELRAYLSEGSGTWKTYCKRLDGRLSEERQIYERTRQELESEKDPAVRQERNDSLRRLGLKTVPQKK